MREAMEIEMGDAEETLPMAGMGSVMSTLEALGKCSCLPIPPAPAVIIYFDAKPA